MKSLLLLLICAAGVFGAQCTALNALANTGTDAGPTLTTCINTNAGGTLDIPAGVYTIGTQVVIAQSITLKTLGKTSGSGSCTLSDATCATLQGAPGLDPTDKDLGGMFQFATSGKSLDMEWIIIDGNLPNTGSGTPRYIYCDGENYKRASFSMIIRNLTALTINKSVLKNAVCGTAAEIFNIDAVTITDSLIQDNGTHGNGHHSDGITLFTSNTSASVLRNTFINNTDIDIVFGGSPNAVVQNNTITHTGGYSSSAFGAMLIHAWPGNVGDYTNADFSYNTIDCGPNLGCGGGLIIGPDMWYSAPTFGGAVHDNTIKRTQIGLSVVGTTGSVEVYDNIVEDNGTHTICNSTVDQATQAYELTGTYTVDRTSDTVPTSWYGTSPSLTGCIPNGRDSSQTAYTSNFGSDPTVSTTTTTATITWTSSGARTSEVLYGTTSSYGSTTGIDYTTVTSHSVTITGLTPATTYHAQAKQKDSTYARTDYSADFTFTTATPIVTRFTGNPRITGNFTIQ